MCKDQKLNEAIFSKMSNLEAIEIFVKTNENYDRLS